MTWNKFFSGKEFIISSGLTLSIFVLEIIFRDVLFTASLGVIVFLQAELPSFTNIIFHIAAGFGDPYVIVLAYFLILSFPLNKFFLVKLGIYLSFIAYLLSILKALYENPRPYWVKPFEPGL